ncbi:COL6A [Mytilus coruscus]|uniref:COL6A n=1 Tax=Mytilus coruscus TaxID=42192 RepID=A0A6J8A5G8_MYTCO|nr:COL6A [Mytilus coruscus]
MCCGCGEPLDLVFLVDGSSRVSPSDFMQEKAFVSSQTMEYFISPDRVRIGVLLFSDGVWEIVDFKVSVNNGDYIHKISDMAQPFGDLLINNALKSVKELFRKEGRPDAKRAVVLITSGRSRILWQSFHEARQLRQEQIALFAIGVGRGVSRSELIGITSDSNNILHVDTFNSLFSLSAKLHELICPGFQAGSIKPTSYESTFLFKPHVELSIIGNNGNKGISNVLPQRSGLIDNQFYKKENSVEQSQRSILYTGNTNKSKAENKNSTNSNRKKKISNGEKKNRTGRTRSETKTKTKKIENPAKMKTQSFIHLPVLVNKKAVDEKKNSRVFKNNSAGIKRDIKSNKSNNTIGTIGQKESKLKSSKKSYWRAKSVNDIFATSRDSKTTTWNNLFDMNGITLPKTKGNTNGHEKTKSSDHFKVGYKFETKDIPEGLLKNTVSTPSAYQTKTKSLNDEPLLGFRKQTIWDSIVESVEPLTKGQNNSIKKFVNINEVETQKVFGNHKNNFVVDTKEEASSVKPSKSIDLDRVVIGNSDNDKEIQYILHIRENENIETVSDLKSNVKDHDTYRSSPSVHNDISTKKEQGLVAKNKTSSSEKSETVSKVNENELLKNKSAKVVPVSSKIIEQTESEIQKEAKRLMYKIRKDKVKKPKKSTFARLKHKISNQKPGNSNMSQTPKLKKKISSKAKKFLKEVDFRKNLKGHTIIEPTKKTPLTLAPNSITYSSRSNTNKTPIVISTTVSPTTAMRDITSAPSQKKKTQKSVKSPKGRLIEMNHKPNSPLGNHGFFGFSKDLRQQVASLLDLVMLEHDRMMKRKKERKKPKKKKQKKRDRIVPTPSVEWRNIKTLMQSINKESKIVDKTHNQKSIKNDDAHESWNYRRQTRFRPGNEVRRKFLADSNTVDNTDTTMVSENEHCKLLPYKKDSSFYIETTENRTVVRPCPTGTAFDIRSCACTTMTTVRGHTDCQPELLMDFDTDLRDKSGKNIHVGSHYVALNNGSADFNGNSDLTIWRFTGSHIGQHLMIKARFKTRKHPEVRQHVVSNCLEGTAISYGIEIDRFEEVVIFVLDTEPRDRKEIKIPFKLDQWTNVSLMYDGLQFTGVVNNRRKSIPSAGNVETRSSPLRVGGCGGKKHGFSGLIDEVSLSFCIPRQNNRRVFGRMS